MKYILILLTILLSSCNPSVYFTDNTGKCYSYKERLRETSNYFVLNEHDDVIAWRGDNEIYGPIGDLKMLFQKEIKCPKELNDFDGYTVNKLKGYGLYEIVKKHININIIK